MSYMKKILLSFLVFVFFLKGFGQNYKASPLDSSSKEYRDIDINGAISKKLKDNFLNYSLFTLDTKNLKSFVRKNKNGKIQFDLSLPNLSSINITIVENDILSADYKLVVATDRGREVFEKKECITYSGSITEQLENTIRLTLTDDIIHGEIKINDKDYFIEPLQFIVDSKPNTIFVLYEKKDVIDNPLNTCGAIEVEKDIQKTSINMNRPGFNCYRVRMAIATDFSAFTALGGTVNYASTHSIAIMNLSAPYFSNSQFNTNVDLVLVGQYISTSLANDPYTCSSCTLTTGIDINTQLGNFGLWVQNGNFGFSFDLAHNITNRYNSEPVVGVAYAIAPFGSIGMTRYNTGVSSKSSKPTWLTFIHEVGHNFGLSHTFQLGQGNTGGFMDYGDGTINGAYGWNLTYSSTEYENGVNRAANATATATQTRLSSCNVIGATITDFITNKEIQCIGSSIQFRDNSLGGPTSWRWTFQDGTPSTSTEANPQVSFSTSGIKSVTLTTNNGNGNTTKTKNIYVSSSITTAACVNSGVIASTIALDLGPTVFMLNTINKASGGSRTDGNKYFDYMCSDNTVLSANSTYNVTINNVYRNNINFQFFIDYNDDGDFLDANETIYNGNNSSTSSSVTFSFTTPSLLPITNKLLRARILSTLSGLLTTVNSCYNPGEYGQVEDYGIVFKCSSPVAPTFTQVAAICSGATLAALPTTSNNSITGTWSPAINNTATTTYTFTPATGLCATTAIMTITVNPRVTPTFTQVAAICSGATLLALPTTSNNSIMGTWSPAINNTATTTYTFTPATGLCATTAIMTITVNPRVTPTFTQVAAICSGATLLALPTTSNNSIMGTWSPAINNTATTTYTFTPTTGLCATTATMTIVVNLLPIVNSIIGNSLVDVNSTIQLSSTTIGGVWNSSLVSTASVSNNGLVFGIRPGLTTITYTVTDANGCSNFSSLLITVSNLSNINLNLSNFLYYPNPVLNELFIISKEPLNLIEIYNLLGQSIRKINLSNELETKINFSELSSATYLIKVSTINNSGYFNVIKK